MTQKLKYAKMTGHKFLRTVISFILCTSFIICPNGVIPVYANDSGVFSGFNSENIDMSPASWMTSGGAAVADDTITMAASTEGTAIYCIDLAPISEAVDLGSLKIDFSVAAQIDDEATGIDTATATVDFCATGDIDS